MFSGRKAGDPLKNFGFFRLAPSVLVMAAERRSHRGEQRVVLERFFQKTWPVMTITGNATPRLFSRRSSSTPLIPGIRTSVMMQPGSARGSPSRNAIADS